MMIPLLLFVFLLAPGAQGQSDKRPKFFYPPRGSKFSYHMMDIVLVTYEAYSDEADFWIFCEPGKGEQVHRQSAPGRKATVPAVLNFTWDTACWFNVRTGPNGVDQANSAYFTVIPKVRENGNAVHGLDVPSLLSPSSAPTTTDNSGTETPQGTASGDDTRFRNGIGIGVAIGLVPCVMVVVWLWKCRPRKRAESGEQADVGGADRQTVHREEFL
ncbi:hypothetical protein VTJ83DRAFT_2309 [Remersonia thermophila]|uniref:Mid2 domain-containing protein n=1 Tax=Remersonia thermophila TaxID=72144 RepID=A0ABR4DIC6_9PEZI